MQTYRVTLEKHGERFSKYTTARDPSDAMRWASRWWGPDDWHVVDPPAGASADTRLPANADALARLFGITVEAGPE
jgi:hypothetical protein